MSDYERQIQRETNQALLQALRHSSHAPGIFKAIIAGTREYYAGLDANDLDRAQVVRLLAFSRRLAATMAGTTLVMLLFFTIAVCMLYPSCICFIDIASRNKGYGILTSEKVTRCCGN
jgi:hypothetical protein